MKTKHLFILAALSGLVLPLSTRAQDSAFKSADDITKQIVVEGRVAFAQQSLPFKLNSTDLATEEAHLQLVEIAKALHSPELKSARFMLVGHTCDLGSEEHNLDLSKRRAAAIKALLKRAGIAEERLVTDGLGETSPAVPNSDEAHRAQNRRVELKLLQ